MSYHWPHHDDLSAPPQPDALVVRRPTGGNPYWESAAFSRGEALQNLWTRWARETGRPLPGPIPEQTIPVMRMPQNRAQQIDRRSARAKAT